MKPPIADPNEAPQARFSASDPRFYIKFWPWFLMTWLATVIVIFPLTVGNKWLRFSMLPDDGAFEFATLALLAGAIQFVLTVLVMRATPMRTNSWGLRAFTIWSVPHEREWSQIVSARARWMGIPYAVVSTADGQRLWLALALQDEDGFAQTVVAHTAPDHPLQRLLRQRGWLR